MYKYFCDYCGERFESDTPELDADGLHNDIPCPKCGSHCSYPDTTENSAASVRALSEYEKGLEESI